MQALHDGVIVDAGNSSASLDPKQIPNDANDKLLKGAAAFAAGKTLGLSEEEVLAAVSRQARAQRRGQVIAGADRYEFVGPQRATEQETVNDLLRQAKQSQAALGSAGLYTPSNQQAYTEGFDDDTSGINPGSAQAYRDGFSVDTDQTYTPNDREYVSSEDRSGKEDREFRRQEARDKRRAKIEADAIRKGGRVFKNPLVSGSDFGEDQGSADPTNPKYGTSEYGANDARSVPTADYIREEAEARSRSSADLLSFDERLRLSGRGEQRALNDERAAVEAASLAGNYGTFPSRPIIVSGSGKMAIQYDDTDSDVKGSYVDPRTGQSIEVRPPESDVIAGSNTPNTGQQLNAPSTRSATEFVAKLSSEGTTNTSNYPYPQVDIGAQLGGLDAAITKVSDNRKGRFSGLRDNVPAQIDSISALQKTTDAILSMASDRGIALGATTGGSRVGGQNIEPGIREALDAVGIKGEYAQEQIALALNARIQGRPVTFDPGSDRMVPDSLPLGGFSYGGKSVRGFPKNNQIKGEARFTEPGTAESAIGAAKERNIPQVTRTVGPAEDVAAVKRLQYLKNPMGKGNNLVQQAADYLRRQGNPSPTFGEAMDLIESGMERRVASGSARPLDEANLARTVDRTEKVASRPSGESEFSAMARLLGGPLRPGEPEVEQASFYEKPNPEMTPGAIAAIQEERSKNRSPGAIPNDPEMSELIRIARRMR